MVGADFRALQCLAQSLLEAVNQLAKGHSLLPPPQVAPSSSRCRRLRRQAILRKFYVASMVKGSSFAHEDKAVQVSLSIGPHVEVQAESAEVTSPGQLVSAVSLRAEADVLIAQLSLKVEQMRKLESESKKKRAETFAHDPSLVAGSCSAVVDGDGNDKADVVRAVAASCGAVDHSSSPNLCDERPETFAHVTSLAAGCGSAVVDGNDKADVVRAVAASSGAVDGGHDKSLFVRAEAVAHDKSLWLRTETTVHNPSTPTSSSVDSSDGYDMSCVRAEIEANDTSLFAAALGAVGDGTEPSLTGASWTDAVRAVHDGFDKSEARDAESKAYY